MTAGCHLLIHRLREKVVLSTVYGGEGKSTMEVLAGEKNMTEKLFITSINHEFQVVVGGKKSKHSKAAFSVKSPNGLLREALETDRKHADL